MGLINFTHCKFAAAAIIPLDTLVALFAQQLLRCQEVPRESVAAGPEEKFREW